MTNDPAFPIVPRQFHARVTASGFEKLKQRMFADAQEADVRRKLENCGVLIPGQVVEQDTSSRFFWPENEMEPEYFLGAVSLPLEHSDFEFVPARHLPKQARDMILRYYINAQIDAKHMRMPPWWPKIPSPWGDVRFDGVWTRRAGEPGCVMVLQSLEHARTGRWTFMRAGKWLTKFAAHLDENERRALTERLTRASTPHNAETLKLEITSRAERARWAYTRMAHCIENTYQVSCMYDVRIVDMNPHPAEVFVSDDHRDVFGPDDLGVAILVNTRLALPAARAVVWPAKRAFVCIYGAEPKYAAVLQDRLETAGYRRAKNFAGAKLRRIDAAHGSLLAPFIDGNMKGVMVEAQSLTIVNESEDDDGYADVYFNTTTGRVGWRYAS